MISELMARPDFIGVLEPDRMIYLSDSGTLLDAAKPKKDYPRFRVRELTAVTWQVFTREQWAGKCELMAQELASRGLSLDNQ